MKAAGPIPAEFVADERGVLLFGALAADTLAAQGTPLFVYDQAMITARVARFRAAFPGVALHYAIKANPYAPLLAALAKLVDGFDVASSGEVERVESLHLPISFAGPGKTDHDIEYALRAGITLNVESEGEAARVVVAGRRMAITPRVAVRVNPPFGLKGSGMKMGGLGTQFGVDHERVSALVRMFIDAGAEWRGLHIYAGSQALFADALIDLQRATVELAADIAEQVGRAPPTVNLGGGFGIPYFAGDQPLDLDKVGSALSETLAQRRRILAGTAFAIELGRWLVGEAGVYLARIVDRKVSRGRTFLVTDGGLQHMLAASGNFGQLLRRNYPAAIANRIVSPGEEDVTIVGGLCTPLDLLADDILLPRAEVGDLVAVFCVGAYGLSASPVGFLSQPMAREVLVQG